MIQEERLANLEKHPHKPTKKALRRSEKPDYKSRGKKGIRSLWGEKQASKVWED
jgi:hypothetical protein